jgi:hypothetical protein
MLATSFLNTNEYPSVTSATRRNIANALFNESRGQARLQQVKAFFTGKRRMPALTERLSGRAIRAQHSRGACIVEVEKIAGTESRADDFDPNFNPRDDRLRTRWVNIAELRLRQTSLPAVDLIQVGNEYFVRDGHHRISVARALGNAFIDATVTVIELN